MMNEIKDFQGSIARIYSRYNNAVGSGFLVADRYLLTCAHVVNAALGRGENDLNLPNDTDEVVLDFPFLSQERVNARVVHWLYSEQAGEDIALLKIPLEMLPAKAQMVRLAATDEFWNRQYRTFGFPEATSSGVWSAGLLRDIQAITGWVQMQDTDGRIEPGFSGGLVWDSGLQGGIGMLVARLRGQQAAFMIPSSTLASMLARAWNGLAYVQLENLLTPYAEKILGNLRCAYSRSCPQPDWPSSTPENLGYLIQKLNDMPDRNGYSALVIFAAYLVADLRDNDPSAQPLVSELCRWGDEQTAAGFSDVLRQLGQLRDIEQDNERACLMIIVKKHGSRYRADGYFIADMQSYESKSCRGAEQLTAEGQDSFAETDLTVIISRFVNAKIDVDYTIELFLPNELLNKPIGIDRLPDDDEPIGCRCPLIVRSEERVSPAYLQRYRVALHKKMQEMPEPNENLAVDTLIRGDQARYENISQALKQPGRLGLKFAREPLQVGQDSSLKAMQVSGVPIAIWLREPLLHIEEADIDKLLNCCLYTLPHRILEQRRLAFGEPPNSHFGHHLALLWDDFRRLPPGYEMADNARTNPNRLKMS